MSTRRATQTGVRFSDHTKLSRAAASKCFQVPSRRMREASQSVYCPSPGFNGVRPIVRFLRLMILKGQF
jgi:hypothetical protein